MPWRRERPGTPASYRRTRRSAGHQRKFLRIPSWQPSHWIGAWCRSVARTRNLVHRPSHPRSMGWAKPWNARYPSTTVVLINARQLSGKGECPNLRIANRSRAIKAVSGNCGASTLPQPRPAEHVGRGFSFMIRQSGFAWEPGSQARSRASGRLPPGLRCASSGLVPLSHKLLKASNDTSFERQGDDRFCWNSAHKLGLRLVCDAVVLGLLPR